MYVCESFCILGLMKFNLNRKKDKTKNIENFYKYESDSNSSSYEESDSENG